RVKGCAGGSSRSCWTWWSALPACTWHRSAIPSSFAVAHRARAVGACISTITASSSPREIDSKDSTPVPANRSSTRPPWSVSHPSRREKRASRTRSAVGRVPLPGGPGTKRPPKAPAMMRGISAPLERVLGGAQTVRVRGCERRVRCQLGLLADQREVDFARGPHLCRLAQQIHWLQRAPQTGLHLPDQVAGAPPLQV